MVHALLKKQRIILICDFAFGGMETVYGWYTLKRDNRIALSLTIAQQTEPKHTKQSACLNGRQLHQTLEQKLH